MSASPSSARVVLLLLLACAGCSEGRATSATASEAPQRDADDDARLCDGRITPTNATELSAPPNVFKVAGWHSESSWTKLSELMADGTAVKTGDVLARFEFRGDRALDHVNERMREADAQAEESAQRLDGELRELVIDAQKRAIDAERARLDTLKAGAVSKRALALFELQHEIAAFEVVAVNARIAALRSQLAAEAGYYEQRRAQTRAELARYEYYKGNFVLLAPHEGVLRHAFNPRERRRMQKGDGMPAGMAVASVARDERLSVRFFVPEHRIAEVAVGKAVTALALASDDEIPATVRLIEKFPQELGFLREDEALPNARDKAFAVLADLPADPGPFAAGSEIKVRLR